MIQIKRAYEHYESSDGYRVLVDRLWPRGVSKQKLRLAEWAKEIAPSTELRKRFAHDPRRWGEFQREYARELKSPEAETKLAALAEIARGETVTLVFGAHDAEHNNAVVLKAKIETRVKPRRTRAPSRNKRAA